MVKIEPIMRANVLALARAYAGHKGLKFPNLSRQCHGDPPWLDNLAKRTGTISARKYDEVVAWFVKNWPADLVRPAIREIFVPPPK